MLVLNTSSNKFNPQLDPFPGATGRFAKPYDFDEVPRQAPLLAEVYCLDQDFVSYKVQGIICDSGESPGIRPVMLYQNLRERREDQGHFPLGAVVRYRNRWRKKDPPEVSLMGYRIVTFYDKVLVDSDSRATEQLQAYRWKTKEREFEGPFAVKLSVSGRVLEATRNGILTRYPSNELAYGYHLFVNRSFACLILPS